MPISLDRIVLNPGVSLVAATLPLFDGLEQAVSLAGIEEVAEQQGTPINELMGRVLSRDAGDGLTGAGDDIAEFAGRQCYRSWAKGRPQTEYIKNVINECHGSIFRHCTMVFQVTGVSRSLTHELVRHGIGTAPSQESQRYVDAKEMRFVVPPITAHRLTGMSEGELENDAELTLLRKSFARSLAEYTEYQEMLNARLKAMLDAGDYKGATSYKKRANEAARAVLPNAAETRLVFSMNLQASRHILSLRGSEFADLEIRRLVDVVLQHSRHYAPAFYAEVKSGIGEDGFATVEALNGKL